MCCFFLLYGTMRNTEEGKATAKVVDICMYSPNKASYDQQGKGSFFFFRKLPIVETEREVKTSSRGENES